MQEPLQKLDIGKNDGYRTLYLVEKSKMINAKQLLFIMVDIIMLT